MKLEIGSLKNVHASFAKRNEKYRLYLISLTYLLDLLFYYDFKFNPF